MYHFIKYLIIYIKHRLLLEKIYKEEDFLKNLTEVFTFKNISFKVKKDWRGALYVLLNPLIVPSEEYIYDGKETLDSFINNFIMDRMVAVGMVMRNTTMFELLTPWKIEKWDDGYNYLAITEPIAWAPFWKWTKVVLISLGILLIGGVIFLIFL